MALEPFDATISPFLTAEEFLFLDSLAKGPCHGDPSLQLECQLRSQAFYDAQFYQLMCILEQELHDIDQRLEAKLRFMSMR